MNPREEDRGWRRFEEDFTEWAAREPRTSPERAARRLLSRLPDRRRAAHAWWVAAAAMVLAALGGVLWMARDGRPARTAVGTVVPQPVLEEGVVLFWIEPDTPVYFVLGPEGPETGGAR